MHATRIALLTMRNRKQTATFTSHFLLKSEERPVRFQPVLPYPYINVLLARVVLFGEHVMRTAFNE